MKTAPLHATRRRRDGAAGFLLTETLATFTISAFVLLGLVSASSVLLRAVDRSVAHVQDVDDLGRTVSAIARDVSGLTRARWNGYEPQPFVFRGGPNSLFFARMRRDTDGARDTRVVSLREITSESGTRLMLGEAHLSPGATGFDDLHFAPQRELGTGTARLRFSYESPEDGQAGRRRLPAWPVSTRLPAAVIVEAVERESGRLILSMRVPINANADIGCLKKDSAQGGNAPQAIPADLAALNASAVGINARTPGSAAPGPAAAGSAGSPSAPTTSDFCGRADARQTGDKASTTNPGPSLEPGSTP